MSKPKTPKERKLLVCYNCLKLKPKKVKKFGSYRDLAKHKLAVHGIDLFPDPQKGT